jgi:hypothetical protein
MMVCKQRDQGSRVESWAIYCQFGPFEKTWMELISKLFPGLSESLLN